MVRFQLELIYLYFPALFLSCRPFVVITTLSTGLVGVEVTSVSWLGQLTVEEIEILKAAYSKHLLNDVIAGQNDPIYKHLPTSVF